MKPLNGVICPYCGHSLESTSGTCFHCKRVLFPWQDRIKECFKRRIWHLCIGIVLLPYVVMLFRGVSPLDVFSSGPFTVACGAFAPFLYFFIFSMLLRKIDLAVRWLIPGTPTSTKLAFVSGVNLALLVGSVALFVYWWLSASGGGPSGDHTTGLHDTSGRAHVTLGKSVNQLIFPSVIALCLVGATLEVLKIRRLIYPEPGLPEDLLDL